MAELSSTPVNTRGRHIAGGLGASSVRIRPAWPRVRELPAYRVAYAAGVAGRVLGGYRVLSLRHRYGLGVPDRAAAYRRHHVRSAERIYAAAVHLQGLMIKIGQTLGSNPSAVPFEYIGVLSRLQDAVPPRPWPIARAAIERELGAPVERLFAAIEPEAVAAASLAQVHRAVLHDGRTVAVKVLYPGIERLVQSDLRVLKLLLWLESRFAGYPLQPVYDELAHNIPLEVDLLHEAAALTELRRYFDGSPDVYLPAVVPELSRRRVLVMEWIAGSKITDLPALRRAGRDPQQVVETLTDLYCRQIFDLGFFHADPHPGNLFILPDGRLAIVDFGLTRRLAPPFKRGLALLTRAMLTGDEATTVEAFDLLGFRLRDTTNRDALLATAAFYRAVTDPATYRDVPAGADPLRRLNEELARTARANPYVEFPGEVTLVGRVFGLLTGVGVGIGAVPNVLPAVLRWTDHALAK